jgi:WD40 repeat protein
MNTSPRLSIDFVWIMSILSFALWTPNPSAASPSSETPQTHTESRPPPLAPFPAEWGKITTILVDQIPSGRLWTGHQGGWIVGWQLIEDAPTLTIRFERSWVAHEGAVRSIRVDDLEPRGEKIDRLTPSLISVGADGTWAGWTRLGRSRWRRRAPEMRINQITDDGVGGWLVAADRGVIARFKENRRLWRGAGEHQRAAFAIIKSPAPEGRVPSTAVSVGSDGWLRRWSIDSGAPLGAQRAHQGWATTLRKLDWGDGSVWLTGGSDGWLRVWPIDFGGSENQHLTSALFQVRAHSKNIIALTHSKKWVVSGGEDGRVKVYRRSPNAMTDLREPTPLKGLGAPILCLSLHRDLLLVGGGSSESGVGEFSLWYTDLSLDEPLRRLKMIVPPTSKP